MNSYHNSLSEDPWFAWNTLSYVFPYLEAQELLKLSRVCQLWNHIVCDAIFWRNVAFRKCKIHVDSMVEFLRMQETVGLTFIDCIFVENPYWFQGANFLEKIDKLEVKTRQNILVKNFCICENFRKINLNFLEKLPNLKTLSLKCNGRIISIESTMCLKKLKSLALSDVSNISEDHLNCLKDLKKLEHIELGNCSSLSTKFYNEILKNVPKLTTLQLGNPNPGYKELKLLKNIISTVFKNMPSLKRLELSHVYMHYELYSDLSLCKNLKTVIVVPAIVDTMYLFENVGELNNAHFASFILGLTSQHFEYFCRIFKTSNDNESFLMDNFALEHSLHTKLLVEALNGKHESKILEQLNKILREFVSSLNVTVTMTQTGNSVY